MFMKKCILMFAILPVLTSCLTGKMVKDVDFPATPVDMSKVEKEGKACFRMTVFRTSSGDASVLKAAKNGGLKTIHMVQYSIEPKWGGIARDMCTYVYGE